MRKYVFLLVGLLFVGAVQAQVSFGVKAGFGTSSLKMDDVTLLASSGVEDFLLEQSNSTLGIHFGGVLQVSLATMFIQPELLFSTAGGNVNVSELDGSGSIIAGTEILKKQTYNRIDVPVIVGWKLGPIRLGLGPVASVVIGSKTELVSNAEQTYKNATWGFQLGAGIDVLDKIGVDFRYEGSLSKLGEDIEYDGQTFATDSRTRQTKFSVTYYF